MAAHYACLGLQYITPPTGRANHREELQLQSCLTTRSPVGANLLALQRPQHRAAWQLSRSTTSPASGRVMQLWERQGQHAGTRALCTEPRLTLGQPGTAQRSPHHPPTPWPTRPRGRAEVVKLICAAKGLTFECVDVAYADVSAAAAHGSGGGTLRDTGLFPHTHPLASPHTHPPHPLLTPLDCGVCTALNACPCSTATTPAPHHYHRADEDRPRALPIWAVSGV